MVDPDVSAWVAEYVLRQALEDGLAHEILLALPLSASFSPRLRHTIILRRLASDLARLCPSFRSLHSLDLLIADRSAPASSSEPMVAAYRAVALHALAGTFSVSSPDDDDPPFRAFLDEMCSRVANIERAGPTILAKLLRELRREIESAATSSVARAALLERDTKEDALDAIRVYLQAANDELGPPLLDDIAQFVLSKGFMPGELHAETRDSTVADRVAKRASGLFDAFVDHDANEEAICLETSRDVPSTSRAACDKNVECREPDDAIELGKTRDTFDPSLMPSTPEFEKAVDALKSSGTDLHRVMIDPLQDIVVQASAPETEISNTRLVDMTNGMEQLQIAKDNGTDGTVKQSRKNNALESNREPFAVRELDVTENRVQTDATVHVGIKGTRNPNTDGLIKTTRGLRDKNPRTHTHEQGQDSIQSSSEKSPTSSKKIPLRSPRKEKVSPSTIMENDKFVKRRKIKRWSSLEEDALRKAVEEYTLLCLDKHHYTRLVGS